MVAITAATPTSAYGSSGIPGFDGVLADWSPTTMPVPLRAETGMSPQMVVPDNVRFAAPPHEVSFQYCMVVAELVVTFSMQTLATPSEMPPILTSKNCALPSLTMSLALDGATRRETLTCTGVLSGAVEPVMLTEMPAVGRSTKAPPWNVPPMVPTDVAMLQKEVAGPHGRDFLAVTVNGAPTGYWVWAPVAEITCVPMRVELAFS